MDTGSQLLGFYEQHKIPILVTSAVVIAVIVVWIVVANSPKNNSSAHKGQAPEHKKQTLEEEIKSEPETKVESSSFYSRPIVMQHVPNTTLYSPINTFGDLSQALNMDRATNLYDSMCRGNPAAGKMTLADSANSHAYPQATASADNLEYIQNSTGTCANAPF